MRHPNVPFEAVRPGVEMFYIVPGTGVTIFLFEVVASATPSKIRKKISLLADVCIVTRSLLADVCVMTRPAGSSGEDR